MGAFVPTVLLIHFLAATGGFMRNHTTSLVNFKAFQSHRLLPPSVTSASSKQDTSLDCAFFCLGFSWCFSYNFQRAAGGDGKHICEALATDRFNHSTEFQPELNFDHYGIEVSSNFQRNQSPQRSPSSVAPRVALAHTNSMCPSDHVHFIVHKSKPSPLIIVSGF